MDKPTASRQMTAPDVNADVRARFEAWVIRGYGYPARVFDMDEHGNYTFAFLQKEWEAYRAAHADLAGEVRALAEAASQGVIDGTGRLYFESGHKADNFRRALAALAKFHPTHQEKEHGA